ncbi:unnamed protein product [Caenorhabditis brenneri]
MELANTTKSFDDQLKKFVVKQLEWERWREKNHEEMGKVFAIIGLVILGLVILVATPFLLHYLWLYWKSRRVGPVTRVPKTPIDEKYLTDSNSYRKDRDWKCLYDRASKGWNMCDGKVEKILKMVLNAKGLKGISVSHDARIVPIRMNEFKFGQSCHEFEPTDGMIPGSHFTYQMFGDDTIEVTRYVVGNKTYVAGFCIYIKNDWVYDIEINMNVVKKLMKEARYPGKEAVEKELKEEMEKMKAGKDIVPSKFTFKFWEWFLGSGMKREQNEVPPNYSSLSVA